MNGRTALFLSSTMQDLKPFREVVKHVCQRLGIALVTMEDFGPDTRNAVELCREKVDTSQLFLGLYAHRYGFRPDHLGPSITEMEYEWARARSLPMLLFLVDDDQPWPPKSIDRDEDAHRLGTFKARIRQSHVVRTLTAPDQLSEDLFVYLPSFVDRVELSDKPIRTPVTALPMAPEPYVAHQYTLLQTEQVIGRDDEIHRLNDWISDPAGARILNLVAIGGVGKSALIWKWFNERSADDAAPLAGRMWWSFYESDAGFERFVTAALAYCGKRELAEVQQLSPVDREWQLLRVLDREPFLLVLDGLERVLIAYASLDFVHKNEEELDEWAASAVVNGPVPTEADKAHLRQHRLRQTIDPRVGLFLRKLAKVTASRVLASTRLYPAALETTTGDKLPGSAEWNLHGLEPSDAVALWRAMGVSGSETELRKLFETIDHYPLLIRALAGEVADYRPAPGDFDAWRSSHPDFDPFELPLIQARSHVLAYALGNLGEKPREVLNTIAAFRSPVGYGTLSSLFGQARRWRPQILDAVLTELEDRGLVGWDRSSSNSYDLHPIVRGVVWSGLDDLGRQAVYGQLERHFSAQASDDAATTASEANPAIELFTALVGLNRQPEAFRLYLDRLAGDRFDFVEAGLNDLNIALLESLFPPDRAKEPRVGTDSLVQFFTHLGNAYEISGRLVEARTCAERALAAARSNRYVHHGHIARREQHLGQLRRALEQARLAASLAPDDEHFYAGELAALEALAGREWTAAGSLEGLSPTRNYHPHEHLARILLRGKNYGRALGMAYNLEPRVFHARDRRLELSLILGEARFYLGWVDEGIALLMDILREARIKGIVSVELASLRCLAEIHRHISEYEQSRAYLDDLAEPASRGPYRLAQADAANVRAALELDCGNHDAAAAAALDAYQLAWCDGPSHRYEWAFRRAARLLEDLKVTPPDLR
jgi:tetratricopeptide (TPR) repeat protein